MSFLFALSPFKALHPSSPPTSTTPQDRINNPQGGRRPLTRNHPAASSSGSGLASPFKTPSKSPSAPTVIGPASFREGYCQEGEVAESSTQAQHRAERSTSVLTTDSGYQGDELDETERDDDLISKETKLHPWSMGPKIDFLSNLPHEVALLIVLNIPTHRTLLDLGLVSTSWRAIANDALIWRHFFHRNPGWALKCEEDVRGFLAAIQQNQDQGLLLPAAQRQGIQDQDVYELKGMTIDESNAGQQFTTPTRAQKGKDRSLISQTLMSTSPLYDPPSNAMHSLASIARSTSTPERQRGPGHSQPAQPSEERLFDRLDWKRVYAARYRLASRFGEVGPAAASVKSNGRHKEARAKRRQQRERRVLEDWEIDDQLLQQETTSRSSSSSFIEDDEDSDEEETIARRRAEEDSYVAASTRTPPPARRSRAINKPDCSASTPRFALRPRPASIRQLKSHLDYIYCLRIFPSYRSHPPTVGNLVTGSKDHTIRVWNLQTGKCLHVLKGHSGSVLTLDVDADGEILVSGSSDRMLGIWSWFGCSEAIEAAKKGQAWTPRLLDRWDCHVPVMDVRLTDRYLVLGLRNGQVRAYTRHPDRRAEFQKCSVYKNQRCSLNDMKVQGDFVAAGFAMGATELIDLRTGESVRSFQHVKGVACVEYDGDILVAGTSDGVIRCWRTSTGQLLLFLIGHEQIPRSLFFDKARGMLISVGYDGIINIWDVTLLIDGHLVEQSALGESWNCLARQFGKQKRWIEEAVERRKQDLERIRERVDGGVRDGEESTAPPSPSEAASTSTSRTAHRSTGAGGSAVATGRLTGATTGMWSRTGGTPPPPPHPLADPPRPYKPRFATRQRHPILLPPSNAAGSRPGASSISGSTSTPPAPAPRPPSSSAPSSCRLFDVAFDGKRLITVGDTQEVTIYEFLHEGDEREWLGWEIFR